MQRTRGWAQPHPVRVPRDAWLFGRSCVLTHRAGRRRATWQSSLQAATSRIGLSMRGRPRFPGAYCVEMLFHGRHHRVAVSPAQVTRRAGLASGGEPASTRAYVSRETSDAGLKFCAHGERDGALAITCAERGLVLSQAHARRPACRGARADILSCCGGPTRRNLHVVLLLFRGWAISVYRCARTHGDP